MRFSFIMLRFAISGGCFYPSDTRGFSYNAGQSSSLFGGTNKWRQRIDLVSGVFFAGLRDFGHHSEISLLKAHRPSAQMERAKGRMCSNKGGCTDDSVRECERIVQMFYEKREIILLSLQSSCDEKRGALAFLQDVQSSHQQVRGQS